MQDKPPSTFHALATEELPAGGIRVSAPGSLMLLGEHAVLHGRLSLVCAVSKRIAVTLTPRSGREVSIVSALGDYYGPLDCVEVQPPLRFVLRAVQSLAHALPSGFTLRIDAEFDHQTGLGSSAAVTASTLAALRAFAGQPPDRDSLFDQALAVVRDVQGRGSGADLAASVFGGIVAYRAAPREISPLGKTHPITVVYSGSKLGTPEVIRQVEARRERHRQSFDAVFDLMESTARQAVEAVRADDWQLLGELLNINQGLMEALGVGTAQLARIVYGLRELNGILGAKISGSGLGDCAIALGGGDQGATAGRWLDVEMTLEGLRFEN
jgi:mevalonate kinase